MKKVLTLLPPALQGRARVNVLTFVSAVGLVMNGDFMDYYHLKILLYDMSKVTSQADLQKLQILSRATLPKVVNVLIWKLHEVIPVRLNVQTAKFLKCMMEGKEERPYEQPLDDVQAVDPDQDDARPAELSHAMCLPAGTSKRWSEVEESLINKDPKLKAKEAYKLYVDACREKKVPTRTYNSFRQRRWVLMTKT